MQLDVKGIVAVLVVVGSFGLIGVYVIHQEVPDVAVIGLCGTALGMVLGFYFGHLNGSQTALANAAVGLAAQALQKRATDNLGPSVPLVAVAAAPPPAAPPTS